MNQKIYIWGAVGVVVLLIVVAGIWLVLARPAPSPTNNVSGSFGTPLDNSNNPTSGGNNGTSNGSIATGVTPAANQKIFEIAPGPVVGALLVQVLHPTTTLARYINQEDGHVYDLSIDTPGAVPRLVSGVTIPGASRALWFNQGSSVILQYIDTDNVTVKTMFLGLPAPTSTPPLKLVAARIQFLPDNIIDLAASPDGASVAYLLKTSSGSDGYIARPDGSGTKKVFSLPLSQVLVSWPSPGTLLVQTKSAAGVLGMAFAVDTSSGATTALLSSSDLTTTADHTFSTVVYQTDANGAPASYAHTIRTGFDRTLAFAPYPEKCIWSNLVSTSLYCAAPINSTPSNYLDLWHQGTISEADSIFNYNITTGLSTQAGAPGTADGGVASDILEMALSPNEHYLSFVTKGVRSLWGVRLSN